MLLNFHATLFISLVLILAIASGEVIAEPSTNDLPSLGTTEPVIESRTEKPDYWGIALTLRNTEIPYATEKQTVSDIVPLLFYKKGRFFWNGLEAGFNFAQDEKWNISVLGRQRFFDIPAEFQNRIRGVGTDVGFRYRYIVTPGFNTDFEYLSDLQGRAYTNIEANYIIDLDDWDFMPYSKLRYKSREFNNHYYGLDIETPGSDIDITVGSSIRYHVSSNLYLLSRISYTQFGSKTSNIATMNSSNQSEVFVGFAFFDDKTKPNTKYLKSKPYVRIAYGRATPSSLGEILKFEDSPDPLKNSLVSVFYGIPVSDTFFGADVPIYFTPGYVHHLKSDVQPVAFQEYVIAIKAFVTVKLPVKIRFGFAEGFSYLTKITYIEQTEMDKNNYRASNLLNYLDLSAGVNMGDLFNSSSAKDLWVGFSIHHRSGVFESSSSFGRVKGGSNYKTFYLQYHW